MKIGTVIPDNLTVFAPLAGITNLPLRLMAKKAGCGLVFSEMISANGLVHRSAKTVMMLDSDPAEKPLAVQLFGADPVIVADAARMVEDSGADIIDVNFGCSVRKVLKTGSGADLMRHPGRAAALLREVRRAATIPVTIKVRSGWEPSGDQAVQIARMAQDCGVDAITVHPRTARQGFGGAADWAVIARVKQAVAIPVIGNGDIREPDDALRMMRETGCDAVMVGRAAFGDPWIFSRINDVLAGRPPRRTDVEQRLAGMLEYLDRSVRYYGETHACRMMRSRLPWFVKGLPHSSRFREAVKRIDTRDRAVDLIGRYRIALLRGTIPFGLQTADSA